MVARSRSSIAGAFGSIRRMETTALMLSTVSKPSGIVASAPAPIVLATKYRRLPVLVVPACR
jgi:hypothetical protein